MNTRRFELGTDAPPESKRRRRVTVINEAPGSDAGSRHATNLELFLDLVFVFAVTQVASFVAHDPTLAGVAKGLLLAWLAWWQWTAFTWAGTAVDLEGDAMKRVMVLCMIPAVLAMAITLPQALTTQGLWFAGAYLVGAGLGAGAPRRRRVERTGDPVGIPGLCAGRGDRPYRVADRSTLLRLDSPCDVDRRCGPLRAQRSAGWPFERRMVDRPGAFRRAALLVRDHQLGRGPGRYRGQCGSHRRGTRAGGRRSHTRSG